MTIKFIAESFCCNPPKPCAIWRVNMDTGEREIVLSLDRIQISIETAQKICELLNEEQR
jgi:hypothetical protein